MIVYIRDIREGRKKENTHLFRFELNNDDYFELDRLYLLVIHKSLLCLLRSLCLMFMNSNGFVILSTHSLLCLGPAHLQMGHGESSFSCRSHFMGFRQFSQWQFQQQW